jgi:potassium-dependent mechanosensitive channel
VLGTCATPSFSHAQSVPSHSPSTSPAKAVPSPTPIGLPEIADEAQSASSALQQIQTSLTSDSASQAVSGSLATLTQQIDALTAGQARLHQGESTIDTINRLRGAWTALEDNAASLNRDLTRRTALLESQLARLTEMNQVWQTTAEAARKASAPPEVLQRVASTIASIEQTRASVEAARATLLSLQDRLSNQVDRVKSALNAVQQSGVEAAKRLFTRDSPPLWSSDFFSGATWSQENRTSFSEDVTLLRTYLANRPASFLFHAALIGLLFITVNWLRRRLAAWTAEEPKLQRAAPVFEVPLATSIALSFLLVAVIYPQAPRPLQAILGATALVPTVIILRRLLEPNLFSVLNAFIVLYVIDQIRVLIGTHPLLERTLLLLELAGGFLVVTGLIRTRYFLAPARTDSPSVRRPLRLPLTLVSIAFLGALVANVLGYVNLASFLASALLHSAFAAFLMYAVTRILEGLVIISLETRPLMLFRAVRRHRALLQRRICALITFGMFFWWLSVTLRLFGIRNLLQDQIVGLLDASFSIGSITISLGRLLAFAIAVWASFIVSRFIRFILEEDVYSQFRLPQGMSYAVSTLLHYILVLLGFFVALGALGFDLTKFTILAGAFSVGVGFGLQNIINNFVSGLILLFERPIKIGDVIQVETAIGEVQRIGIRASIIRTTQGSEIIVPNGALISGQVTNWTFSGRERLVELQVTVARTNDCQRVREILISTAANQPGVVKQPAPRAFVTNLTASGLTYQLRVWTDRYENWEQLRSDLSVEISGAFAKENISLA